MHAEATVGGRAWDWGVRWCVALLALAAVVLAGGWLAAGRPPAASGVRAPAAGGLGALSRFSVQAQSVISTTIAAGQARFLPRRRAGGFGLDGGGVGLRLDSRGVSARASGGSLSVGLVAVGRGARLRAVAEVAPRARAGRVVYVRGGGVSEWYAAGPLGVEQGFGLARRPAGRSGAVSLVLAVGGSLRARLRGLGVEFLSSSRRVAVRYGGLAAFDARGRRLAAWLSLSGSRMLLRMADRGARYPLRVDPFIQQGPKLTASDEAGTGAFGLSVALSADGNTALIGGRFDNGSVGAAWVFTRSGSTWTQQGSKLTASDETGGAAFGSSVALSADGNTALIGGAFDNGGVGAAWVFTRSGSTWTQHGSKLTASDETGAGEFGATVALSEDGNTALIGGPDDNGDVGAAWVFTRSAGAWTQQGSKLTGSGETTGGQFGWRVALSGDGNTALIGGPADNLGVGAAWVFTRSGSTWTQQGSKLTGSGETGSGEFGDTVALSGDGNTALIGAPFDNRFVGAAWVFTRTAGAWTQQGPQLTGSDETGTGNFGDSVTLSADGNTALIGGPGDNNNLGAAWVFTRSAGAWTQQGSKLTGSDETGAGQFGISAALSADGITALIGGYDDNAGVGAAWVFFDEVAPAITSRSSATFTVGHPGSFTVTATGRPTPSLSESGALPAGVSFTDNGNGTASLSGTPAAGSGGVYHLTITAGNGVSPNASQSFTLTVQAPPTVAIKTPAASAAYARGQFVPSSFSCSEGAAGPGIASCVDQQGRASGAPLDTATAGAHTFTATATSKDGLSASKTVSYAVQAPAPPPPPAPRSRARVRIGALHPAPLGRGCAVETGGDEHELTALSADATCRHLRLTLRGSIRTGGKLAASAGGTVTLTYKVSLPGPRATGRAHATVGHGRWRISLILPGVNLDPLPPSYLLTIHYSGDPTLRPASTSRRIRLESEPAGL